MEIFPSNEYWRSNEASDFLKLSGNFEIVKKNRNHRT